MDNQRIDEMGQASKTMGDAEFQSKFRMTKDEFLRQYEYVATGTGPNAAATWSKRSNIPETATDSSSTRSDAKKPPTKPTGQESTERKARPVSSVRSGQKGKIKGLGKLMQAGADQKAKLAESRKKRQQTSDARQKRLDAAHERRTAKRENNINRMGRRGSVGTFGFLGALVDGVTTYSAEREEDPNGSKLVDAAKATGTAAAWLYAPGIMWSITGASIATMIGKEVYEDANRNYQAEKKQATHITKDASGNAKGTLGGELIDSETAYTMRQRNEQVMRQHKIATESILGSEARQLHR